jgi:uncharacterized protein YbjT (DUF2867 family)
MDSTSPQRVAVVGASGFVGRHVVAALEASGHDVVPLTRRRGVDLAALDPRGLVGALAGCDAIVHCAGINRERGGDSYDAVHVRATAALVAAARDAGVRRFVLLGFLRARPDGPSAYHRSKWAAEAIVRESGLASTIVKAGVIHGRGDHLLDHLSHALQTFPVFPLVGRQERRLRPVAAAAAGDPRLADRTIAVVGPETVTLRGVVQRVGREVGRRPVVVRVPVAVHLGLARLFEAVMRVPLVSLAQVQILAEDLVEPAPAADAPPEDLEPSIPFSPEAIRAGLPAPGAFRCRDLRWWPA